MNAYLLSIVRSPKDENSQPLMYFLLMRENVTSGSVSVVSDSHKGIPGKNSHCQFERIPLILTYTPKTHSWSASEPLEVSIPLKLSRQEAPPLRFETCPHPSSRPPAEIPVTSSCPDCWSPHSRYRIQYANLPSLAHLPLRMWTLSLTPPHR